MRWTVEAVEVMVRHQVSLYLAALVVGVAVGLGVPALAGPAGAAVTPVLALLLYATFLGVPLRRLGRAALDVRFLVTVLVLDFLVVPLVVLALSRPVAYDPVLLLGVLIVLLTPCIDYVVVFTGLAGGARDRLLAATPVLLLGQLALLPGYLWLMAGPGVVGRLDPGPFLEAFAVLLALPLAAAWLTQAAAARRPRVGAVSRAADAAMVPLMMLTLALVVASQAHDVGRHLRSLLAVVPVYVLFAAVMVALGLGAGRVAGLDGPARRAVVFTGVTRNSLVVLPLVLALPASLGGSAGPAAAGERLGLAPLVVVTQTLVELVVMVLLVRWLPRLVSAPGRSPRDPCPAGPPGPG
ncbi:arsenic resistance protein [Citricoccus sp. SGAir0253]|uniref:bile acid:sodium symporter n=1 Tax=Citricoccus sp. SGAir0253 TaxID=2567881 RepID=UPI0010CCD98E|nr:bile acid:sodium symporter [Citricoccus sp. SGAir0253]QCU78253.1 arsenic resistance protein [Citricoccus sp. SGAir0253]